MDGQPISSRQFLPDHPQHSTTFRRDNREQVMSARQAAEALFTPKREVAEQPVSEPSQAAHPRKPRVLPILPPTPIRHETVDAPVSPERPAAPEIPAKKLAQARTLMKYGMSASQVADLYRVPVATIERILHKA
jgi:hypothetical protein